MAILDQNTFDPTPTELAHKQDDFSHFLVTMLIVTTHVFQVVALLTLAFAIGAGWWSGLAVFAAIGLAVGVTFSQGRTYWTIQIAEWVLLAAGGLAAALF